MGAIKKLFSAVDMTAGRPWEKILLFTIPMLLGNIAQQLYNTVDSIVVGKYVGDNALAAVGSATPILNLLIVLFVGISVGSGIMVSQYYGAKKREELSLAIGNSITLTVIASLIIMVVATLASRPLLEMLKTPDAILDWATSYLRIMFLGIAGMALYNIFGGILRGLGDSISALVYLLIATVLNIILDVWFVAGFGWGVSGVALATAIAQAISGLLCLLKLMKMQDLFDFKVKYFMLHKESTFNVIRLGLPSGITQALFSVAMIAVQSLTNTFGAQYIAANVIIMRVDGFVILPAMSFGTAMTTYAGQNVGAGDYERVSKGAKEGTWMAVAISAVIVAGILFFGRPLMSLFTDTESLVNISMSMMQILAVGYIAIAISQCLSGVMRGAGDTMNPMWISLISSVLIRVPLGYFMVHLSKSAAYPNGRFDQLFISLLISWGIGALLNVLFYAKGTWREKAL